MEKKRRKPAGYIWLPVSGIAAMFLIGVFIFKSNDSSSERKSENKIVKQTLPQNPFIDEPEGEKTNEVIQKK